MSESQDESQWRPTYRTRLSASSSSFITYGYQTPTQCHRISTSSTPCPTNKNDQGPDKAQPGKPLAPSWPRSRSCHPPITSHKDHLAHCILQRLTCLMVCPGTFPAPHRLSAFSLPPTLASRLTMYVRSLCWHPSMPSVAVCTSAWDGISLLLRSSITMGGGDFDDDLASKYGRGRKIGSGRVGSSRS